QRGGAERDGGGVGRDGGGVGRHGGGVGRHGGCDHGRRGKAAVHGHGGHGVHGHGGQHGDVHGRRLGGHPGHPVRVRRRPRPPGRGLRQTPAARPDARRGRHANRVLPLHGAG